VVEPVEALAQEAAEAEGAQLLGRVLARQEHVEVVAAPLELGHAAAEAEHQLPASGHGDQQGTARARTRGTSQGSRASRATAIPVMPTTAPASPVSPSTTC